MIACRLSCFRGVWLCVTLWTVAHRLLSAWDSPGKSTGVGCHVLPDPGIEPVSLLSPAPAGGFFTRTAPVSGVVAADWLTAPAVAGPFTILCVGVKKKGRIERESRRGGGEGPDRTEPGPRPPAPKPRWARGEGGRKSAKIINGFQKSMYGSVLWDSIHARVTNRHQKFTLFIFLSQICCQLDLYL